MVESLDLMLEIGFGTLLCFFFLSSMKFNDAINLYVKEFNSSALDIKNMLGEDMLFNSLFGWQPWAWAKLHRQEVIDLSFMIVAVNGMVDFKSFARDGSCASPSKSRIKDKKKENNNKKKKFGGGGFKPAID